MDYPLTSIERLKCIAIETARMSYPGSMSRGKRPVVSGGTKSNVEHYFAHAFPMEELWTRLPTVTKEYDAWHEKHTRRLGRFLESRGCLGDARRSPVAVAAKFLNTFMHQIMKYPRMQPLWPHLHLPLDSRIFGALRQLKSPIARKILEGVGEKTAYELSYSEYFFVQAQLLDYMRELNGRRGRQFAVHSRIELNLLWL